MTTVVLKKIAAQIWWALKKGYAAAPNEEMGLSLQ